MVTEDVTTTEENTDRNTTEDNSSASEYIDDAIGGAEEAGDDMAEGITDAADDIIDGFDGEKESSETTTSTDDNQNR